MQLLKQSTAATVPIGVAVDAADGVTPEVGLVAGAVDSLVIFKHNASAATDISGTTALTHIAAGQYTLTFSTTDTNTLGRLKLFLVDTSICRPLREEFMVVPANVYDAMVGGSDNLKVDTVQFLGNAVTLSSGNLPDVNVKEISDDEAAADTFETYLDGGAVFPVDMIQISGSAPAANTLELYTTGGDRMPVDVEEIGSGLDFSATMKTALETAVANTLDAAIPGTPTANSINQRMKAVDDLIQAAGGGDLAAIKDAILTNGVKLDLTQALDETPNATSVGAGIYYALASVRHKVGRTSLASLEVVVYRSNGTTPAFSRNLDAASNAINLTPA